MVDSNLTLGGIRYRKELIEREIYSTLAKFEKETGVGIKDITIRSQVFATDSDNYSHSHICGLSIVLENI